MQVLYKPASTIFIPQVDVCSSRVYICMLQLIGQHASSIYTDPYCNSAQVNVATSTESKSTSPKNNKPHNKQFN